MSTTRKLLLLVLFSLVVLVAISMALAALHGAHHWEPRIMMFDQDLSGSVVGWMIAIPAMLLAFVVVLAALSGVGILLALLVALAVVVALFATLVGFSVVLIPIAAFLAIPALIVWALIRANQRRGAAIAAAGQTANY